MASKGLTLREGLSRRWWLARDPTPMKYNVVDDQEREQDEKGPAQISTLRLLTHIALSRP